MTANQINFNNYVETKRHNQATERTQGIQADAAYMQAEVARSQHQESVRHNLESERVNWWNAQEIARHNVAGEAETQRHNRDTETLNWFSANNDAVFKQRQAAALQSQASTAERNASTRESELAETIRHSLATEEETKRRNLVTEELERRRMSETERANRAQESIGRSSVNAQFAGIAENTRHNQATEAELSRSNQAREFENYRANLNSEDIRRGQLNESIRANQANEALSSIRNVLQSRTVSEQERHNIELESQGRQQVSDQRKRTNNEIARTIINGVRVFNDVRRKR